MTNFFFNSFKKTIVLTVAFICIVIGFVFYRENQAKHISKIFFHYRSDRLKYLAAVFLVKNLKDHYSVKTRFLTNEGKDYTNFVSTYSGKLEASQVLDSLRISKNTQVLPDSEQVDDRCLINSIDAAFDSYDHPIGFKSRGYSFQIFLNYVLPYRVGFEELNDWRRYSRQRYLRYLSTFNLEKAPIKTIYKVINSDQEGTSRFALIKEPHISRPAVDQTVDQILKVRVPFDCEDYAIRSLYILRSLGIPCAYERIPLWGKFNSGHVQESVLFENEKFYPVLFGDTVPFKYQIAKMYRRTFQKQTNPKDQIRRLGELKENIPNYFDYSDYIDITNERTDVSNIVLRNIPKTSHKVLYLCIYNTGSWKPVEWAEVNKTENTVSFKNMGRKILYQLASIDRGQVNLINPPFVLDTVGNIHALKTNFGSERLHSIKISEYDRNKPIVLNHYYRLDYWNDIKSQWVVKQIKKAESSSLFFYHSSANQLYRIEAVDDHAVELNRPFTYQGKQVWW